MSGSGLNRVSDVLVLLNLVIQRSDAVLLIDAAMEHDGPERFRPLLQVITNACECDARLREAVAAYQIPALLQADWMAARAAQTQRSA